MALLLRLVEQIDRINSTVSSVTSWLFPLMALLTFCIAILRYVFSVGWIWTQEMTLYMHGILFMLTAGGTLFRDGHVRVDIFYRGLSPRRSALVDIAGVLGLLVPFCLFIIASSLPYVWAAWQNLEGSPESGGLPAVFILKTVIVLMPVLLLLQGFALGTRSFLVLFGKEIMAPAKKSDPELFSGG